MKTLRRVVVILILLVAVGLLWAWVGRTSWASTLDAATAGEQFGDVVEPIETMAGWLLVAVPSVLLARSAWAWTARSLLGRDRADRIQPARRSSPARPPAGPEPAQPDTAPKGDPPAPRFELPAASRRR